MKTKMKRYSKLKNGEFVRINLDNSDFKFACCDCGSVHSWQFHHIKNNTWDFALFFDEKSTKKLRKKKFGYLQQTGELKIN